MKFCFIFLIIIVVISLVYVSYITSEQQSQDVVKPTIDETLESPFEAKSAKKVKNKRPHSKITRKIKSTITSPIHPHQDIKTTQTKSQPKSTPARVCAGGGGSSSCPSGGPVSNQQSQQMLVNSAGAGGGGGGPVVPPVAPPGVAQPPVIMLPPVAVPQPGVAASPGVSPPSPSPVTAQLSPAIGSTSGNYVEVWRDDFNGNSLNASNWKFVTGGGGFGNNELEYYTDGQNILVQNGILTIQTKVQQIDGYNFTSTRLNSLQAWTYGLFQARAKLPKGKDLWPAIWLYPQSSTYGEWAASGEIDIMEYRGQIVNQVEGTIWYGASQPNQQNIGSNDTVFPIDFSADFHVFGMEWTQTAIKWLVDGQQYFMIDINRNLSFGAPYTANGQPFDRPFFWILNVAVGGIYFPVDLYGPPVTPDEARMWANPNMQLDYVSVSQRQ